MDFWGCFQFLVITSKPAVKIHVHIFVWIYVFIISLGWMPSSVIAGLYGKYMVRFLRSCQAISQSGCTIYIPSLSVWGCSFSASSHICVVTVFYFSCSNICMLMFHDSFNLHFPNDRWCWTYFYVLICHVYILFAEMSGHVFCPFYNWIVWLFTVEFWEFFLYL